MVNNLSLRSRLNCHQGLAQQVSGDAGGIVGRAHQFHSALAGVRLNGSLAAAAGVDLRFHHGERAAERAKGSGGLLGRVGHDAARNWNAGRAEDLFALKLVDFHVGWPILRWVTTAWE